MRSFILAAAAAATVAADTTKSFGTLVSCPQAAYDAPCLWAGPNGELLETRDLQEVMVDTSDLEPVLKEEARRNLEEHMEYMETVRKHADRLGHTFSYDVGVNHRHLQEKSSRELLPELFVQQEVRARERRRLQTSSSTGSTTGGSGTVSSGSSDDASSFNWCDENNPKGHSVCSAVKSQENCGSCWAFAAADAIEAAVAINEDQKHAVALSPQQFLSCSHRQTEQTFEYCWLQGDVGASWIKDKMVWSSKNNGCNGGMTHGAFMDAAQDHMGLVTMLDLPYDDESGSTGADNATCSTTPKNKTAASISGYEQAMGVDCTSGSSAVDLLKSALKKQPIAVAMNSGGSFKDYAGGLYSCPNDGDLTSKSDINHALVLVGYGTDSKAGDYWIIKNSYSSSWGDKGFLKLLMDDKLNCGLNVFPVIPTGAKAGVADTTEVDGGGSKLFVGLSVTGWISLAAVVSVVTLVLTGVGLWYQQRKRLQMRKENAANAYQQTTDAH